MNVAILQANPIIGDLPGNARLIRDAALTAAAEGCDLLLGSELLLSGYPPKDLLLREGFVAACDAWVERLAAELPPQIGVLVGHPTQRNVPTGRIANGASLIADGKVLATIHKRLLPNYDVFDERRYFRPATDVSPIVFRGRRLGVHICEDGWFHHPRTFYPSDPEQFGDPIQRLADQRVDLLLNLSASPFERGKPGRREHLMADHVQRHRVPFLFANQVGGNDDIIFDGNSFVLDASGRTVATLPGFRSGLLQVNVDQLPAPQIVSRPSDESDLLEALVLGLGDYVRKTGFLEVVLGLSGGIDSALVAYLAARALGPKSVHGILLPSRYSSDHSVNDAVALAKNLGIDHAIIPIDLAHKAFESLAVLGGELLAKPGGLTEQNLQSRIRGTIVMARSNEYGWLALATGNKSELAMGYCTLYGDMNGSYAVLSDVLKRDIFHLCRYINKVEGREVIPVNTIEKPPSAELAPNQFDQDTLPPYDLLDAILEGLVEDELSVATLSARYPRETVEWVACRLDMNEYKRWQMPPGAKVTRRAYGSGRRMPMAAKPTANWGLS